MVGEKVEWHVSRDGRQIGPFSQAELDEMQSAGQVTGTDLLWREGWPEWVPAKELFGENRAQSKRGGAGQKRDWSVFLMLVVAALGLLGALAGGLLSNWHNFFPRTVASVEACDPSLSSVTASGEFSGVYAGIIEDGQGRVDVQLKLVRNGNAVQGEYFRAGVCGKVFGEVVRGRMLYQWTWAGASGRGIATQEGTKLTASSGHDQSTDDAGTLVLLQRGK